MNGPLLAIVAIIGLPLLGMLWAVPLRRPLFVLVFLGLALDVTGEGPWDSPVASFGVLFHQNLNKTFSVEALTFPLVALVLVYLLIIYTFRRLSDSRIDDVGRAGFATPMNAALAISFLAVIAECVHGELAGGYLQMAKNQVQSFVLLLLMAYLAAAALRSPHDRQVLGRVILAAAFVKSLMALWVFHTLDPQPPFATSHGDSLLFACATVILIVRFAERAGRRSGFYCLAGLPLLFGAMIANNRRLVWAEVVASLLVLYLVSRKTRLKRLVTRLAILAMPLVLVYVAAGWNSNAKVFAPVKAFRTMGDANVDSSTLFREVENYNLLQTWRLNPVTGAGFGRPFIEFIGNEDISFFKEYHYLPHNSLLGLWCFAGLIGFTGLSTALVVGVFCAARSYLWAQLPVDRAAAFVALAMVLIYWIQCWGDIGFSEKESIYLVGPALGLAGRLVVSTGAWGGARATHARQVRAA